MYVYLGEDMLVRAADIIAILDKETVKFSKYMDEISEIEQKPIVYVTKGSFKSIVITEGNIYYSPLASATLKKRSEAMHSYI